MLTSWDKTYFLHLVVHTAANWEQAHQEGYQEHKHDRVKDEATELGRALWAGDPAARDGAHKLVRLRAGDNHVGDGGQESELKLRHFLSTNIFFTISSSHAPGSRACVTHELEF